FRKSPGVSVKLTALHPRFEFSHAAEAVAAILPVMRELALKASKADVHLTIDAEEADRLELQLDVFEALLADDALFANGWGGFGIAIQGYQKRAAPLCDWVAEAARAHGRKLMVRLVKGAYWDTEIKAAQVAGRSVLSKATNTTARANSTRQANTAGGRREPAGGRRAGFGRGQARRGEVTRWRGKMKGGSDAARGRLPF